MASAGAAAAYGTGFFEGVRIWISGEKVGATVTSLASANAPTAADLRELIRSATFPVVLPVGLPAGTRVVALRFAPVDHPNVIDLEYRNERANRHWGITLFDSSAVATIGTQPNLMRSYMWKVGRENVVIVKRTVRAAQATTIRNAMSTSTPRSSFSETVPMLANATILGNAKGSYQVAERYGAPGGHSVLIGSNVLQTIPMLEKQHKPILDTHIVYLTNIPAKNRQPVYSKARLSWPHTVMVGPQGVRSLGAVLRFLRGGGQLPSAMIFNESDPTRITVIEGPLDSPKARSFSVDPNTLKVSDISNG